MLFHARVQFEFQIRHYSTTCINFYIFQICLKVFYTVIINVSLTSYSVVKSATYNTYRNCTTLKVN
jgi:hypothetical protein